MDGRLEREETAVIFWQNEKTCCKVVFVISQEGEEKVYLLFRKSRWIYENLYDIKEKTNFECTSKDAKYLWKALTDIHDFDWISNES